MLFKLQPGGTGESGKKSTPRLQRMESVAKDYVTIAPFSDAVGDGISFEEGQHVKVGYVFVTYRSVATVEI